MKRIFLILVFLCQIVCSLADDKNIFPNNYFPYSHSLNEKFLKSIYIEASGMDQWKKTIIPIDTVARYLVQVANNVEFANSACTPTKYEAIENYTLNNNRFLVYKVIKPGDIIERYICDWTGKPGYPVTLLIYKSIAGKVEIFSKIKYDKITITYNYRNPPFFPTADVEVFELSSGFPLLFSSFRNQTVEK